MNAPASAASSVPALERGLRVLELIVESPEPPGFNSLAKALGVSATTMARLLAVLIERGYVTKDEDRRKYLPGPRVSTTLGWKEPIVDQLRTEGRRSLVPLIESSHCTALVFYFNRSQVQCVAKVTHPDSLAMQEVGTISSNLSITPWGWLLYEALNHEQRFQSLKHMSDPERFMREIDGHLDFLHHHGFACDRGLYRASVRRLAAPVRGENGSLLGALALGGTSEVLSDDRLPEVGDNLKMAARALSRRLGASD